MVLYDAGADASLNRPGEIPPSEDISFVARDVAKCLESLGHLPVRIPAVRPIETTIERIRAFAPDLVFNLCEGFYGASEQEGNVAGMLGLLGVPCTGNCPATLHLCLHKGRVKEILRANRVPTPKWFVAQTPFFTWKRQVPLPAIVKPAEEDASLGIEAGSVVRSVREMRRRVEFVVARYGAPVLVEEFVDGREINAAVVGGRVLEISEISFARLPRNLPRIVTYRGKWDEKSPEYRGTVPVCPARIPKKVRAEAERVAVETWRVLGGRDYGRVDLRVARDGKVTVLEFNPNPDFSKDAGLANCARASGWTYRRLVAEVLRLAEARIAKHVPKTAEAAPAARRGDA
ncbi:MAG: D-alanine--D-alanine ligase family protein [Planctomycetota bacterium]